MAADGSLLNRVASPRLCERLFAHPPDVAFAGLAEIAPACGCGDPTAFTRQFRVTVGMPPATDRNPIKRHG